MKAPSLSLIAAIGWLILSAILLTLPGKAFPEADWLDKIWFDKWVHIGMFTIMVVLWCFAWRTLKKSIPSPRLSLVFTLIAAFFLAYGIAMEFVQLYFVANRSFDVGDIVADAVGCATGLIFSTKRYIKK